MSDPVGDARADPLGRVPVSPDLIAATIEVSGGNLTLTVSFAAGTFSSTQTLIHAMLDTDENVTTGSPNYSGSNDAPMGTDYLIFGVFPGHSTQVQVRQWSASSNQFVSVGTVGITFPSADQARVTVPLTMLGNDDGRLRFKVLCSHWLTDTSSTILLDYMPDLGQAPGLVR